MKPRPRPQRAKGAKRTPPARSLPGGGFSKPGKTLAVAARPTPTERVTLESTAPMGQGFGRHPRGGMQIFFKTFKIRYTLWKMILGGIPAKEDHKAPSKNLAGDDSR